MRGFLRYVRKQLRLNPKTEIFPKQDYVNENEYGNGITLPYRSYNIDPQNSPCALVVYRDKVVPITPEQFIVNAKNCAYSGSHFVNYDPDDLEEDTIDKRPGYEQYRLVPWLFPSPTRIDKQRLNNQESGYIRSHLTRLRSTKGCWNTLREDLKIDGVVRMARKTLVTLGKDAGLTNKQMKYIRTDD